MLARIARTCYRRRRRVAVAWIVALVIAVVGGSALAGTWATGNEGTRDRLAREFPDREGNDAAIVFTDVTRDRAGVDAYLGQVATTPGITDVRPLQISSSGHIALAPITITDQDDSAASAAVDTVERLAQPLDERGIGVEFSGSDFQTGGMPGSEVIGLAAAIVILLIAFGSVVAMGVPIVTALFGIGIATAAVGVVANFLSTPDFTPQVASMIGIGVGIDYALFIVTRYRDALDRGVERRRCGGRGDERRRAGPSSSPAAP